MPKLLAKGALFLSLAAMALITPVATRAQSGSPVATTGSTVVDISYALKNRIAANINSRDWGVRASAGFVENFYSEHPGLFSELEATSYRRALLGMMLVSGFTRDPSSIRIIFYNVAYDVGLILAWSQSGQDFILKDSLLVSGELLRQQEVKNIPPGWIGTDPLANMGPAYKVVVEKAKDTIDTLNSAASPHRWTIADGRSLTDREIVHQRLLYETIPLELTIPTSMPKGWTEETVTNLANAKSAGLIAKDIVQCSKNKPGMSGRDIFTCILEKDKFSIVAAPTKTESLAGLGEFFATTFVEGVLPFGKRSIAFVSSAGFNNNYRFIVATKDGKPDGLTLIDFDE